MHRACAPAGPSTARQHLLWRLAAAGAAAVEAAAAAAVAQAEAGLASAEDGRHGRIGAWVGTWSLASHASAAACHALAAAAAA